MPFIETVLPFAEIEMREFSNFFSAGRCGVVDPVTGFNRINLIGGRHGAS
ncbi:hypothetical protein [Maridesulfovibrio bastinii]|jgi:hypothetical protein|nr:hypothetical protein [Maridesulfovibrio bastinii]